MYNRLLFLAALAIIVVGAASEDITRIPASQDVYVVDEQIVSKSEILRCEVGYNEVNGSLEINYTSIPMVQFDISNLNMTENDIGILVLKAKPIEKKGNESLMVTMLPVNSEWDENSDFNELTMNMLPIWKLLKKNDLSQVGTSSDADSIIAFDVSNRLLDAKSKGNLISFLLQLQSDASNRVDFMSRETGSGPYLIVMPYPSEQVANLTQNLPVQDDETGGEEIITEEGAILENESQDLNLTATLAINESIENPTVPNDIIEPLAVPQA